MTQAELRESVVRAAQSWLGRKEADGSHREIIDLYNSHKPLARGYRVKYTDAWCSTFASAVAIRAGLTHIIPTECGCEEHIKRFQAMNAWVEDDAYIPSPGDYIFYDWQDGGAGDCTGRADHVGIVTACDGRTVTVIEGNKNDAVGYRTLAVNGRYIRGYGAPDYGSLATEAPAADLPWYEPYRRWVMEKGIADGTRGDQPCTRAECWAMLKRLSEGA
ncbi:MAG: CHAP domain-containing protein [Oscillospiraceae bacterium]|nr:CHAP domain-containing protein [Oscillospiraceae bacterium]